MERVILNSKKEIIEQYNDVENIESINRIEYLQCVSSKKYFFKKKQNLNGLDFYHNLKFNQNLCEKDYLEYHKIKGKITLKESSKNTFDKPAIFCSFHYGSYKTLGAVLYEKGIEFSIVMSTPSINSKKEVLSSMYREGDPNSNKELDIINADNNSALLKIRRALLKGKSIIVYIDGGQGINTNIKESSTIAKIKFLNTHIYSRTGIAHISQLLNVPIIPVVSSYNKDYSTINFRFYNAIYPNIKEGNSLQLVTQYIWNCLEGEVEKDPTQWEAFLYSHYFRTSGNNKIAPIESHYKSSKYCFNKYDYYFFKKEDDVFLYELNNLLVYKLTDKIYKFLLYMSINENKLSYKELLNIGNKSIITDMINNRIIIAYE